MGCTTSAPNEAGPTPATSLHALDTNTPTATDDMREETERLKPVSSGLANHPHTPLPPPLPSPAEVAYEVSQNNSPKHTFQNGSATEVYEIKYSDIEEPTPQQDIEDRLSTLEEVVEKVVELYGLDGHDAPETKEDSKVAEEKQMDTYTIATTNEGPTNAGDQVETEVGSEGSPSQSVCSRATRWEALADVAAELPPSLTVDPLTGQIYALSK